MNDNLMTPSSDPVQSDPNKNYLNELVGDGKKFKSPEDLAKGKYEADQYVKHMERQLDEMRTDYTKLRDDYQARAKLEEIIDRMNTSPQQQPTQHQPQAQVVQQQPQIDPKAIESLVSSKIMEHEASKKQQTNFDLVKSKLQERFGNNYQNVLKEQVEQLGLTEDFVNDLARKHPSVLLKTLGVDGPAPRQSFQAPLKTEQRNDNFAPTTQKRTWAYYQNLKKADPTVYFNPQTQVQLHHDAIALGDEFKDGDYNAM